MMFEYTTNKKKLAEAKQLKLEIEKKMFEDVEKDELEILFRDKIKNMEKKAKAEQIRKDKLAEIELAKMTLGGLGSQAEKEKVGKLREAQESKKRRIEQQQQQAILNRKQFHRTSTEKEKLNMQLEKKRAAAHSVRAARVAESHKMKIDAIIGERVLLKTRNNKLLTNLHWRRLEKPRTAPNRLGATCPSYLRPTN